ncbi:MAG: hypothetical protein JW950_06350, partial [Deltaproteobacteria bacterium]|nr:hypothetical protein [Deltaproteobacteria bacterium]
LFTKEQLEEFSKDHMGLAMEALAKNDVEGAKRWMRRHDASKDVLHDTFLNWVAALLSHIYDRYGEDAAAQAIRDTVGGGQAGWGIQGGLQRKQLIDALGREEGLKAWLEFFVEAWREHGMYPGTTFEEDDEKIILTVRQCGSGGRLINKGAYEGPFAYRKFKKAAPHTWGEENLPIYCGHCPWAHVKPFPKKPGDPCIFHIYKDPKDIPEKYFKRLGMTREPAAMPPTYGIDPDEDAASKWKK